MDVLRQILENLVYFSIAEEDILLEFQELNKDDPQYVELMHKQQTLRDATKVIEDSLFALSKRVPQVSSKINREINAIDKKTGSAVRYKSLGETEGYGTYHISKRTIELARLFNERKHSRL